MKNVKTVYKIITLGDTFAGKSCIVNRFVQNEFENLSNTIGVDFFAKEFTMNDTTIKLQIYDTSGQEQFKSITSNYYKRADGILFVFDLTREETFKNIQFWIREMKEQSDDFTKVGMVLLGNKSDLAEAKKVDIKEGMALANTLSTKYFETSALNGYNIQEAFQFLVEDIINKKTETGENVPAGVVLEEQKEIKTEKKKCCSK